MITNYKTPHYTIFPFPVMSPPHSYLKIFSSASRSHILHIMYSTSMGKRRSAYSYTRYFTLNMLVCRWNLVLWLFQQQWCAVPFSETAIQQETHIQLPFWRTVHLKKTYTRWHKELIKTQLSFQTHFDRTNLWPKPNINDDYGYHICWIINSTTTIYILETV